MTLNCISSNFWRISHDFADFGCKKIMNEDRPMSHGHGPIFIRLAVVVAKISEILRKFELIAVQGHPRSSILVTIESDDEQTDGRAIACSALSIMLLCCALKTDKLTAGNVNRPLDLDDNFNLSLLSRHEVTIT